MEAIAVKGDSMYPVYRDGDTIYLARREIDLPIRATGEFVVELADGRVMIKIVEPDHQGTYTLLAYNAAPISNTEIVRAFQVRYIRRAG